MPRLTLEELRSREFEIPFDENEEGEPITVLVREPNLQEFAELYSEINVKDLSETFDLMKANPQTAIQIFKAERQKILENPDQQKVKEHLDWMINLTSRFTIDPILSPEDIREARGLRGYFLILNVFTTLFKGMSGEKYLKKISSMIQP